MLNIKTENQGYTGFCSCTTNAVGGNNKFTAKCKNLCPYTYP